MTPPRLMLPALLTGTLMGFLDLFVVTVALPAIRADLHAGVAAAQLVLSAYVVGYGALLVTGGRLGDRFGRRRLFLAGMAAFTVTSLGCALAPSIAVLVAMRALQGGSAAAMLPQVLASVQAVLPEERRRSAIGLYGAVIGAASVLGQVLGGVLVDVDVLGLGWRALFCLNLPLGAAGLALARASVPESRAPAPRPLDLGGAAVLTVILVLGLVGLTEGPTRGWPAWTVLAPLVGLVLVPALWRAERRADAPLLPPRLLAQAPVRLGLALTLAFYASNTGSFVVLTLFLQEGLGASALTAGLAFAPLGLAFMAVTILARRPGAPSGTTSMLLGATLMALGLAGSIAAARAGAGVAGIAAPLAVDGAGQGLIIPPLIATVLAHVGSGDEGAATGVLLTATQIANALGIALLTGAWTAAASGAPRDGFAVGLGAAIALVALTAAAALALRRAGRVTPPGVAAGPAPAQ